MGKKLIGWIGVDLDGTLAKRTTHGGIGEPIPVMWDRVRDWISGGFEVRIFTVRAHSSTGAAAVNQWLKNNALPALRVTNIKAPGLIALWDDKAVRVEPDTGRTCTACGKSSNAFSGHMTDC